MSLPSCHTMFQFYVANHELLIANVRDNPIDIKLSGERTPVDQEQDPTAGGGPRCRPEDGRLVSFLGKRCRGEVTDIVNASRADVLGMLRFKEHEVVDYKTGANGIYIKSTDERGQGNRTLSAPVVLENDPHVIHRPVLSWMSLVGHRFRHKFDFIDAEPNIIEINFYDDHSCSVRAPRLCAHEVGRDAVLSNPVRSR